MRGSTRFQGVSLREIAQSFLIKTQGIVKADLGRTVTSVKGMDYEIQRMKDETSKYYKEEVDGLRIVDNLKPVLEKEYPFFQFDLTKTTQNKFKPKDFVPVDANRYNYFKQQLPKQFCHTSRMNYLDKVTAEVATARHSRVSSVVDSAFLTDRAIYDNSIGHESAVTHRSKDYPKINMEVVKVSNSYMP